MEVQSIHAEPGAGFRKVRLESKLKISISINVLVESPLKLIDIIEDEITHDLIHHTTTGDNAYEEAKLWLSDNLKL
jgi:hypothetical protein